MPKAHFGPENWQQLTRKRYQKNKKKIMRKTTVRRMEKSSDERLSLL